MEPGDIILYRNSYNRGGHAQIVYSLMRDSNGRIADAWIIHGNTAGIENHAIERRISRYDPNHIEGTVQKIKFTDFYKRFQEIDSTKAGYINYFVLLRPTIDGNKWLTWENYTIYDEKKARIKSADGKTVYGKDKNGNDIRCGMRKLGTEKEEVIQITDAAKDRIRYPGIYVTKTSNYKNKTVVPVDGEVEYTVTVKNFSKIDYNNLRIAEKVPSNAVYVFGGDRVENDIVVWDNVTIPAGGIQVFTYRVRTPSTIGTMLIAEGKINNIVTTNVKNICGRIFTENEVDRIRSSFFKLKDISYNKGLAFINEVYKDAFGIDIGISNLRTSDVLDDANNVIGLKNMVTLMHNDSNYDYARYSKFYYDYEQTIKLYNTQRIREVNMHPGEVILTSKNDINNAYIYLGDVIVGNNKDGYTIYSTPEEKDKFLKDLFFADEIRDANDKYIERNKFKVKNIVISPANVVLK